MLGFVAISFSLFLSDISLSLPVSGLWRNRTLAALYDPNKKYLREISLLTILKVTWMRFFYDYMISLALKRLPNPRLIQFMEL